MSFLPLGIVLVSLGSLPFLINYLFTFITIRDVVLLIFRLDRARRAIITICALITLVPRIRHVTPMIVAVLVSLLPLTLSVAFHLLCLVLLHAATTPTLFLLLTRLLHGLLTILGGIELGRIPFAQKWRKRSQHLSKSTRIR